MTAQSMLNPVTVIWPRASTASVTSVASAAITGVLLAANSGRMGVIIQNTDANALFLAYAATATTAAGGYTVQIPAAGTWEMPYPIYSGVISGIWAADGAGAAVITELTE